MKDWYRKCVSTDEWEYTSQLMGALSRPLNYSEITDMKTWKKVMEICFFQLFYGNGNLRKQAHGLLSQEEKKLKKTQDRNTDPMCCGIVLRAVQFKETVLNTEAVWHLIYFATFQRPTVPERRMETSV